MRYTQVACSIINCNLLVVVTFIYRRSRSASSSDVLEDDDHTRSDGAGVTTQALTTVDLSLPIHSGGSDMPCDTVARQEC